jgi:hypothetical protein
VSEFIRDYRERMRQRGIANGDTAVAGQSVKPKFEDTPAGKAAGFVLLVLMGWGLYSWLNPSPEKVAEQAARATAQAAAKAE